jgi:16S rRNA (guanine966-N2)-methyltransferase
VFNSLGGRVVGSRVLELFAGTGALGLECLSRGASRVLCVEKSPRHARFIRRNLELTRLPSGQMELRVQDAFAALMQLASLNESFDLILADPPYGEKNVARRSTSFAQRLLDDTALPTLLGSDGLLILGHTRRDTLDLPVSWQERKLLRHGDTVMRFLEREH